MSTYQICSLSAVAGRRGGIDAVRAVRKACQQWGAGHNFPQATLETACEDCGEKIEKPQEAS